MRGAFGKPQGTVARVHIGQVIMSIRTKAQNKEHVVAAQGQVQVPGQAEGNADPPQLIWGWGGRKKVLDPPREPWVWGGRGGKVSPPWVMEPQGGLGMGGGGVLEGNGDPPVINMGVGGS